MGRKVRNLGEENVEKNNEKMHRTQENEEMHILEGGRYKGRKEE